MDGGIGSRVLQERSLRRAARPRLLRPVERQRPGPRTAQPPRCLHITACPCAIVIGGEDHRHAVVTIGRRTCRLGHHHRIAAAPFVAIAPDPGGGEQSAIGKRKPATRLAALRPFRLRPRRKRDQAAPFREAVAPEKAAQLVGARIVDRLRLERLPFRALAACLLYTSPSPRDRQKSRMPSSA